MASKQMTTIKYEYLEETKNYWKFKAIDPPILGFAFAYFDKAKPRPLTAEVKIEVNR